MIELTLKSWQVIRPTEQTLIYKVYRMLWSRNCVLANYCHISSHILITEDMNYARTFKYSPRISVPLLYLRNKKVIPVCFVLGWFERTERLVLSVNERHYRITHISSCYKRDMKRQKVLFIWWFRCYGSVQDSRFYSRQRSWLQL